MVARLARRPRWTVTYVFRLKTKALFSKCAKRLIPISSRPALLRSTFHEMLTGKHINIISWTSIHIFFFKYTASPKLMRLLCLQSQLLLFLLYNKHKPNLYMLQKLLYAIQLKRLMTLSDQKSLIILPGTLGTCLLNPKKSKRLWVPKTRFLKLKR